MMSIREVAERVRGADELLVAMNIDETIIRAGAPKGDVAVRSRWLSGAEEALVALSQAPGVSLAVMSGETYGRLSEQTRRLRHLWRIAEHGAVIGMPDGGCLIEPRGAALAALSALGDDGSAHGGTVRLEGVLLEGSATGVAIHSLAVTESVRSSVLSALIDLSCRGRALGMKLVSGRLVVEARREREQSAASAFAKVLDGLPRSVLPIYAGCESGDRAVIALARERGGLGVLITRGRARAPWGRKREHAADLALPSPEAWVAMLGTLAEIRQGRRRSRAARAVELSQE